jgi:hypothetical protein
LSKLSQQEGKVDYREVAQGKKMAGVGGCGGLKKRVDALVKGGRCKKNAILSNSQSVGYKFSVIF